MLLSVDDFERMAERDVAERTGRPIVGVDLGGGQGMERCRGRVGKQGASRRLPSRQGIPDIDGSRGPRLKYREAPMHGLARDGPLAPGARAEECNRLAALFEAINGGIWDRLSLVVCDRFRLGELQRLYDTKRRSFPAFQGGPKRRLTFAPCASSPWTGRCHHRAGQSRPLLAASPWPSPIVRKTTMPRQHVRLAKKGTHNCTARDDVAAALVLGAGVFQRSRAQPKRSAAHILEQHNHAATYRTRRRATRAAGEHCPTGRSQARRPPLPSRVGKAGRLEVDHMYSWSNAGRRLVGRRRAPGSLSGMSF